MAEGPLAHKGVLSTTAFQLSYSPLYVVLAAVEILMH